MGSSDLASEGESNFKTTEKRGPQVCLIVLSLIVYVLKAHLPVARHSELLDTQARAALVLGTQELATP